ncbi:Protein of unknown function with HXXEE motif-containing protein [Epilithonimonas bovis DSM 19482]|uniref:HXXEE domain-containing protein n=1 Tax=Epilithonimonas bovis DSM 19482 TaxID=1121284 RepID=A0A1U7PR39_9FLAO|nr:HXXEE domain-containing protein [Epilithonimonas bovis]SIT95369.1 Protein of unknown function with HXXEE motif-containing protein [Epilithonimonas bovis DSM 19482]
MDFEILIMLLPIIFMIHDFEEIIFFKKWIEKNEKELISRFPKIGKKISSHLNKISTASFTVGVAEEFLIISIVTILSLVTKEYNLWYGIFIGFSLHIIVHIIQWIIFGKYIPSIITSFLVLPYCLYTFLKINNQEVLSISDQIVWGILGFILVVVNLIFVHFLILKFEKNIQNK